MRDALDGGEESGVPAEDRLDPDQRLLVTEDESAVGREQGCHRVKILRIDGAEDDLCFRHGSKLSTATVASHPIFLGCRAANTCVTIEG
ncbi:hypothetical protein GCM10009534_51130 [Kribbella sandramycini]